MSDGRRGRGAKAPSRRTAGAGPSQNRGEQNATPTVKLVRKPQTPANRSPSVYEDPRSNHRGGERRGERVPGAVGPPEDQDPYEESKVRAASQARERPLLSLVMTAVSEKTPFDVRRDSLHQFCAALRCLPALEARQLLSAEVVVAILEGLLKVVTSRSRKIRILGTSALGSFVARSFVSLMQAGSLQEAVQDAHAAFLDCIVRQLGRKTFDEQAAIAELTALRAYLKSYEAWCTSEEGRMGGTAYVLPIAYVSSMCSEIECALEEPSATAATLTEAISTLLILERCFPQAFTEHFEGLVDVLLGWALDGNLKSAPRQQVLRCLGSWGSQWAHSLDFSLEVLGNMVADVRNGVAVLRLDAVAPPVRNESQNACNSAEVVAVGQLGGVPQALLRLTSSLGAVYSAVESALKPAYEGGSDGPSDPAGHADPRSPRISSDQRRRFLACSASIFDLVLLATPAELGDSDWMDSVTPLLRTAFLRLAHERYEPVDRDVTCGTQNLSLSADIPEGGGEACSRYHAFLRFCSSMLSCRDRERHITLLLAANQTVLQSGDLDSDLLEADGGSALDMLWSATRGPLVLCARTQGTGHDDLEFQDVHQTVHRTLSALLQSPCISVVKASIARSALLLIALIEELCALRVSERDGASVSGDDGVVSQLHLILDVQVSCCGSTRWQHFEVADAVAALLRSYEVVATLERVVLVFADFPGLAEALVRCFLELSRYCGRILALPFDVPGGPSGIRDASDGNETSVWHERERLGCLARLYSRALMACRDPSFTLRLLDLLPRLVDTLQRLPQDAFYAVLHRCADPTLDVRTACAATLLSVSQTGVSWTPQQTSALAWRCIDRGADSSRRVRRAFLRLLGAVACGAPGPLRFRYSNDPSLTGEGMASVAEAFPELLLSGTRAATFSVHRILRPHDLDLLFRAISYQDRATPRILVPRHCGEHSDVDDGDVDPGGRFWKELLGRCELYQGTAEDDAYQRLRTELSVTELVSAWWAIQDGARHCVSSRLRTHFGGPSHTFAALEAMYEQVSERLSRLVKEGSSVDIVPARLLLEFHHALEKSLYAAYGSSLSPRPPGAACLFFRGNREVCDGWLTRVGKHSVQISMHLQAWPMMIYQVVYQLREAQFHMGAAGKPLHLRLSKDWVPELLDLSLALYKERDADQLRGMLRWIKSMFAHAGEGPRPTMDQHLQQHEFAAGVGSLIWLEGLALACEQHFEAAIQALDSCLADEEDALAKQRDVRLFLQERVLECYMYLGDWVGLHKAMVAFSQTNQDEQLAVPAPANSGVRVKDSDAASAWPTEHVRALADFQSLLQEEGNSGVVDKGRLLAAAKDLEHPRKQRLNAVELYGRCPLQAVPMLWCSALAEIATHGPDRVACGDRVAQTADGRGMAEMPRDCLSQRLEDDLELYFRQSCLLDEANVRSACFVQACALALRAAMPGCLGVAAPLCQPDHGGHILFNQLLHFRWQVGRGAFRGNLPLSADIDTAYSLLDMARICRDHGNTSTAAKVLDGLLQQVSEIGEPHQSYLVFSHRLEELLLLERESASAMLPELLTLTEEAVERALQHSTGRIDAHRPSLVEASADIMKLPSLAARLLRKVAKRLGGHHPTESVAEKISGLPDTLDAFFASESGEAMALASSILTSRANSGQAWAVLEAAVQRCYRASCAVCPGSMKSWHALGLWTLLAGERALDRADVSARDVLKRCPPELPLLERDLRHFAQKWVKARRSGFRQARLELIYSGMDIQSGLHQVLSKHDSGLDSQGPGAVNDLKAELIAVLQCAAEFQTACCRGGLEALRKGLVLEGSLLLDGPRFSRKRAQTEALLQILRVVSTFGEQLGQAWLGDVLRDIPYKPWQTLIPQLMALLRHPQRHTREAVETVLLLLARQAPLTLVYPVVVEHRVNGARSGSLRDALNVLLAQLPKELVGEINVLVSELCRMTVLWEEQWGVALQEIQTELVRKSAMLEDDAIRTLSNSALSDEQKIELIGKKYSAVMAPLVELLEKRTRSTWRAAETDHEREFVSTFSEQCHKAVTAFKTPTDPTKPALALDVLRKLHQRLSVAMKAQSRVRLSAIAPKLRSLKQETSIPIPGLLAGPNEAFHRNTKYSSLQDILRCSAGSEQRIVSFVEEVDILPTKTRPKKMKLVGTNGVVFTYLLKGREDLRLDERLMQLLGICNMLFDSDQHARRRRLTCRSYSVTPLSERAGLIQWVDGVRPTYDVYKAWLESNKTLSAPTTGKPSGQGVDQGVPVGTLAHPRPSDLYFAKMSEALGNLGLKPTAARKTWPLRAKRRVLLDLTAETPADLLAREIWSSSETMNSWYRKQGALVGSAAAMSIIGYVIGLGDRHLDNILIDFATGELLHIDYNICFDKGLSLKVPEIVPFRLTNILRTALGIGEVDGSFRTCCETTMSMLQRNQSIILGVLEAFVYDPLVEWVADRQQIAVRREMEVAASLTLFHSRVQEKTVPLHTIQSEAAHLLPEAVEALRLLCTAYTDSGDILTSWKALQDRKSALDSELAVAVEREASTRKSEAHNLRRFHQDQKMISRMQQTCAEVERRLSETFEPLCSALHVVGGRVATSTVAGYDELRKLLPFPVQALFCAQGQAAHPSDISRGQASVVATDLLCACVTDIPALSSAFVLPNPSISSRASVADTIIKGLCEQNMQHVLSIISLLREYHCGMQCMPARLSVSKCVPELVKALHGLQFGLSAGSVGKVNLALAKCAAYRAWGVTSQSQHSAGEFIHEQMGDVEDADEMRVVLQSRHAELCDGCDQAAATLLEVDFHDLGRTLTSDSGVAWQKSMQQVRSSIQTMVDASMGHTRAVEAPISQRSGEARGKNRRGRSSKGYAGRTSGLAPSPEPAGGAALPGSEAMPTSIWVGRAYQAFAAGVDNLLASPSDCLLAGTQELSNLDISTEARANQDQLVLALLPLSKVILRFTSITETLGTEDVGDKYAKAAICKFAAMCQRILQCLLDMLSRFGSGVAPRIHAMLLEVWQTHVRSSLISEVQPLLCERLAVVRHRLERLKQAHQQLTEVEAEEMHFTKFDAQQRRRISDVEASLDSVLSSMGDTKRSAPGRRSSPAEHARLKKEQRYLTNEIERLRSEWASASSEAGDFGARKWIATSVMRECDMDFGGLPSAMCPRQQDAAGFADTVSSRPGSPDAGCSGHAPEYVDAIHGILLDMCNEIQDLDSTLCAQCMISPYFNASAGYGSGGSQYFAFHCLRAGFVSSFLDLCFTWHGPQTEEFSPQRNLHVPFAGYRRWFNASLEVLLSLVQRYVSERLVPMMHTYVKVAESLGPVDEGKQLNGDEIQLSCTIERMLNAADTYAEHLIAAGLVRQDLLVRLNSFFESLHRRLVAEWALVMGGLSSDESGRLIDTSDVLDGYPDVKMLIAEVQRRHLLGPRDASSAYVLPRKPAAILRSFDFSRDQIDRHQQRMDEVCTSLQSSLLEEVRRMLAWRTSTVSSGAGATESPLDAFAKRSRDWQDAIARSREVARSLSAFGSVVFDGSQAIGEEVSNVAAQMQDWASQARIVDKNARGYSEAIKTLKDLQQEIEKHRSDLEEVGTAMKQKEGGRALVMSELVRQFSSGAQALLDAQELLEGLAVLSRCDTVLKELSSIRRVSQESSLAGAIAESVVELAARCKALLETLHSLAKDIQSILKHLKLFKGCCKAYMTGGDEFGQELLMAVSDVVTTSDGLFSKMRELPESLSSWTAGLTSLAQEANTVAGGLQQRHEARMESETGEADSVEDRDASGLGVSRSSVETTRDELERCSFQDVVGQVDGPPCAADEQVPDGSLFALRRLRRVREKLNCQSSGDGGANAEEAEVQDADARVRNHVDYLLGQATSVDNLCNMFEGWTPWI